jgi:tetratricopeptide (TPR) repeat protein
VSQPEISTCKNAADFNYAGVAFAQLGKLVEAIASFRQAIALQCDYAEAFYNLGVALSEAENWEEAIAAYQKAITIQPDYLDAQLNLAAILTRQNKIDEAIFSYQNIIFMHSDCLEAYLLLGDLLSEQDDFTAARECYQQALVIHPNSAEAHYQLGVQLAKQNDIDAAIAALQNAIQLQPDAIHIHYTLGLVFSRQGNYTDAIACYQTVLALDPHVAEAHASLGLAYYEQGLIAEAMNSYDSAIALKPDYAEVHTNLGLLFAWQNQFDRAIACYQRRIEIDPYAAVAYNNLGNAWQSQGNLETAISYYKQAISIQPDFALAHFNLANIQLLTGDFANGLQGYEWRWLIGKPSYRSFTQPAWDGSLLNGQRILIWCEQAYGDIIQFSRFISLVSQLGGKVIFECPPPLIRLLRSLNDISELISTEDRRLPTFELHAPLLSLPMLLGTTLDTIPNQVPYLNTTTQVEKKISERVISNLSSLLPSLPSPHHTSLNVGIVWASGYFGDRPEQLKLYQTKSCPLACFLKLLELPHIHLYSLQFGRDASAIEAFTYEDRLHDLSPLIHDFADTAELISQLDLIITVDTAAAHLAGAMGKLVWVLLPFIADWRWLLDRTDSPWYPTMRLFRQKQAGDWQDVFARVFKALQSLAESVKTKG